MFIRKWLTRLAVALALTVAGTAGGLYLGHHQLPPDPGGCLQTLFTPEVAGSNVYVDGSKFYDQWLKASVEKNDSVYVADYTYNSDDVTETYSELIADRNVKLYMLLDMREYLAVKTEQPQVSSLEELGAYVVVGTSPHKHAIMHNKFTVIVHHVRWFDFRYYPWDWGKDLALWVQEGSWNYTNSADDQANALTINTCPSRILGLKYLANWNRLHDYMKTQAYHKSTDPKPADPQSTDPK